MSRKEILENELEELTRSVSLRKRMIAAKSSAVRSGHRSTVRSSSVTKTPLYRSGATTSKYSKVNVGRTSCPAHVAFRQHGTQHGTQHSGNQFRWKPEHNVEHQSSSPAATNAMPSSSVDFSSCPEPLPAVCVADRPSTLSFQLPRSRPLRQTPSTSSTPAPLVRKSKATVPAPAQGHRPDVTWPPPVQSIGAAPSTTRVHASGNGKDSTTSSDRKLHSSGGGGGGGSGVGSCARSNYTWRPNPASSTVSHSAVSLAIPVTHTVKQSSSQPSSTVQHSTSTSTSDTNVNACANESQPKSKDTGSMNVLSQPVDNRSSLPTRQQLRWSKQSTPHASAVPPGKPVISSAAVKEAGSSISNVSVTHCVTSLATVRGLTTSLATVHGQTTSLATVRGLTCTATSASTVSAQTTAQSSQRPQSSQVVDPTMAKAQHRVQPAACRKGNLTWHRTSASTVTATAGSTVSAAASTVSSSHTQSDKTVMGGDRPITQPSTAQGTSGIGNGQQASPCKQPLSTEISSHNTISGKMRWRRKSWNEAQKQPSPNRLSVSSKKSLSPRYASVNSKQVVHGSILKWRKPTAGKESTEKERKLPPSPSQLKWRRAPTPKTGKVGADKERKAHPSPSQLKWRRVPASKTGKVGAASERKLPPSPSQLKWRRVPTSKTGKVVAARERKPHPSPSQLKWRRVPTSKAGTVSADKERKPHPSPSQLKWRRVSTSKAGVKKSTLPASIPSRHSLKWRRVSSSGSSTVPAEVPPRHNLKWRRLSSADACTASSTGHRSIDRRASQRKSKSTPRKLPAPRELKWRRKSLSPAAAKTSVLAKQSAKQLPSREQLKWRRLNAAKSPVAKKKVVNPYHWVRDGLTSAKSQASAPPGSCLPRNALQLALYGANGWKSLAVQRHMRYVAKTAALRTPSKNKKKLHQASHPQRVAACKPRSRTTRFVNISGDMYASTSRKLQRVNAPQSQSQKAASSGTSTSTKEDPAVIVPIRGIRYQLDSSGQVLRRLGSGNNAGSKVGPSNVLRTYHLGGVLFQETPDGTYVRCSGVKSTQLAKERVRRSIQLTSYRKSRTQVAVQFKGYCAFYKRFGHCRNGVKCMYVHDRDKVAVCRKFLKGLCDKSAEECLLSHTLSKNKVPVCNFFLQGSCPNDNCRYAHVNVSKDASPCKDFLDGNCPLGEKCAKKHVEVCMSSLTGKVCREGSSCRFYHLPGTKSAATSATSSRHRLSSSGVEEPVAFRKERLRKAFAAAKSHPTILIENNDGDDDNDGDGGNELTDTNYVLPRSPLKFKPSFLS